jgi:hypothetical protein
MDVWAQGLIKQCTKIMLAGVLIAIAGMSTRAEEPRRYAIPESVRDNPLFKTHPDKWTFAEIQVKHLWDEYSLTTPQIEAALAIYRQVPPKPNEQPSKEEVKEFAGLKKDIRKTLAKGEAYPMEKVRRAFKGMEPYMEKGMRIILDHEAAFHEILDEKQKKKHQKVLDGLKTDLEKARQERQRWVRGEVSQEELAEYAATPEEKDREMERRNPIVRTDPASVDYWEVYVKAFIEAFDLDKGQQTMVWSVFGEIKTRGEAYKKSHEREYADITASSLDVLANFGTATKEKKEELRATIRKGRERRKELDKPLCDMFEDLKRRLMAIPTKVQIQKAGELNEQAVVSAGRRPGNSVATQPGMKK